MGIFSDKVQGVFTERPPDISSPPDPPIPPGKFCEVGLDSNLQNKINFISKDGFITSLLINGVMYELGY